LRVKRFLPVEITLVRVEVIHLRVVITFVPAKFTLRVDYTMRVEITLYVLNSHFAFRNYTMRVIKNFNHRKQHRQTQYEQIYNC
jgi:hypothetical protein